MHPRTSSRYLTGKTRRLWVRFRASASGGRRPGSDVRCVLCTVQGTTPTRLRRVIHLPVIGYVTCYSDSISHRRDSGPSSHSAIRLQKKHPQRPALRSLWSSSNFDRQPGKSRPAPGPKPRTSRECAFSSSTPDAVTRSRTTSGDRATRSSNRLGRGPLRERTALRCGSRPLQSPFPRTAVRWLGGHARPRAK